MSTTQNLGVQFAVNCSSGDANWFCFYISFVHLSTFCILLQQQMNDVLFKFNYVIKIYLLSSFGWKKKKNKYNWIYSFAIYSFFFLLLKYENRLKENLLFNNLYLTFVTKLFSISVRNWVKLVSCETKQHEQIWFIIFKLNSFVLKGKPQKLFAPIP